jgi:hypothetical protein
VVKVEPPIARVPRTDIPPSQPNVRGREDHGRRPDFRTNQPVTPTQPVTPVPQPRGEDRGRRPDFRTTQPAQPVQPLPKPQASVQPPPSRGPVFQRNQGSIDARDASRRGQMSREQINRPAGPVNSAPRQAGPVNPPPRPANPQAQQHRRPR